MKIERKHIFPLLWFCLILYASLTPAKNIPKLNIFEHFDKFVHFSIYLGLCFLLIPAILKKGNYQRAYWFAFVTSFCVGIGFELAQMFLTQSRSASIYDAVFNLLGAFVGIIAYHVLIRNRKLEQSIFKIE